MVGKQRHRLLHLRNLPPGQTAAGKGGRLQVGDSRIHGRFPQRFKDSIETAGSLSTPLRKRYIRATIGHSNQQLTGNEAKLLETTAPIRMPLEGQGPLRPDMDFLMGAVGVRSVLVDGGAEGATLTAKSDAFAVRTGTDAVSGDAGRLEATEADATRVRLALEGSRPYALSESAVLTPSVEFGVRHDGGNAETGFGADIGAGVALSYPSRGLSAEIRAQGVLTHENDGVSERGLSGTLAFDPAPESDRGLSLSLTQTVGAGALAAPWRCSSASPSRGSVRRRTRVLGADALMRAPATASACLTTPSPPSPRSGSDSRTPTASFRLGWRLAERVSSGLAFELGLEGTRSTFEGAGAGAEHGLVAGAGWRLVGRGMESLALRIEAVRIEASNDNLAPEHSVGVRVGASW